MGLSGPRDSFAGAGPLASVDRTASCRAGMLVQHFPGAPSWDRARVPGVQSRRRREENGKHIVVGMVVSHSLWARHRAAMVRLWPKHDSVEEKGR